MTGGAARSVLRRRLVSHRLVGEPLPGPADAVRRLGCVQSQEHAHAFWSLALRSHVSSFGQVRDAFDRGEFLRTHILRQTWHFVAPEDIRWILAATSERVQQGPNAGKYRELGLDPATRDRSSALMTEWLRGENFLTRKEIGARLEDAGIPLGGERLAYLVMNAELDGLVCSGPMRGAQHTYALLDDRVPLTDDHDAPDPEMAVADLLMRFISSHGPVSLRDFSRWSSQTLGAARAALEMIRDHVDLVLVEDDELWFDPRVELKDVAEPKVSAYLFPLYDEAVLSYTRVTYPMVPGHPHRDAADWHVGSVVVDGVNVGHWRRVVKARRVEISTTVTSSLTSRQEEAVDREVERLAAFLDLSLVRL